MITPVEIPFVTLLTDFGNRDHYVGVMKGVIARICPAARVVDISHEVQPFQIGEGGYLLSQAWPWFPPGTVHVAVVDPGVGTERRALVAQFQGHRFVLPDNGLLSRLQLSNPEVREIRNPALLLLHPVSRTFHGRDVFAPAAAHLAAGFPFEDTGPPLNDWIHLPAPPPQVLHIDRFGNVVTTLVSDAGAALQVCDTVIAHRAETYGSAPPGELFLITGSGGYLEISLREGSAAKRIGCGVGDPVMVL